MLERFNQDMMYSYGANKFPFINTKVYLQSILKGKNILVFEKGNEQSELSLPTVMVKNPALDGNLRMIESYLPEILFALAEVSEGRLSIERAIKVLKRKISIFDRDDYAEIYLRAKMLHFFENLLFADLFAGVWNGKVEFRCFVMKEGGELGYYQMHNIRGLIPVLLKQLSFSLKKWKGAYRLDLAFLDTLIS